MTDTKIEDLRLPPTVVSRIVDKAIGPTGRVSKEARTAIARAASVFILNITSYANDYAVTKKRKTLSPEDIFQALQVIECDHVVTPLMEELEAWKTNKAHRSEETKKRKAEKKATTRTSGEDGSFTIAPSEEMRLRTPENEP
ncbi:DNA polymerase epsilon subunit 3 [Trichostrongylus colubriformis]|uniref:DNA polymerase epsilon subunit 3 n=1 Tax=Trichostrongylus colubriformis TaxID=6319 RepID=A0AAN8F2A6_TRICO